MIYEQIQKNIQEFRKEFCTYSNYDDYVECAERYIKNTSLIKTLIDKMEGEKRTNEDHIYDECLDNQISYLKEELNKLNN